MARHTKILVGETVANSDETISGSLAEAVNDAVSGKTIQAITAVPYGKRTGVILIFDD